MRKTAVAVAPSVSGNHRRIPITAKCTTHRDERKYDGTPDVRAGRALAPDNNPVHAAPGQPATHRVREGGPARAVHSRRRRALHRAQTVTPLDRAQLRRMLREVDR